MKILLDECVPRKFNLALFEHQCRTVPEEGFAGKKNGELLSLAEQNGFEVFLTLDKGVEYEQSLIGRRISVIVVRPKSNRLSIHPGHRFFPNLARSIFASWLSPRIREPP